MAWLKVDQTLKDHRKILDVADELEIQPPYLMGLLISFWLWALDNAPSGNLEGITPRMIARAAQWDGPAEKFTAALIRAGWLDEKDDGTLEIHDWYEYTGKLTEKRKNDRERLQKWRENRKEQSQDETLLKRVRNADVTLGETLDETVTNCVRVEKSRVDKSIYNTLSSPSSEEEDTPEDEEPKLSPVEIRFTEFWNAYPKKVGKQHALKAWNKIKPTAELHSRIIKAIADQKKSDQWCRENGRFIPNPATWLNGGYWDNEVEEVKPNGINSKPTQPSGSSWTQGFVPAD